MPFKKKKLLDDDKSGEDAKINIKYSPEYAVAETENVLQLADLEEIKKKDYKLQTVTSIYGKGFVYYFTKDTETPVDIGSTNSVWEFNVLGEKYHVEAATEEEALEKLRMDIKQGTAKPVTA